MPKDARHYEICHVQKFYDNDSVVATNLIGKFQFPRHFGRWLRFSISHYKTLLANQQFPTATLQLIGLLLLYCSSCAI